MARVAVLVEKIYEDLELQYPKYRLREAGHTVDIIGPVTGQRRTPASSGRFIRRRKVMPYQLNEQEMDAVAKLDAPKRYAHFLSRVADWQELWTLRSPDGFVGIGDADGNEGIPFWPHPLYAQQHVQGDWADCEAKRLSADEFIEKWLSGMEHDGRKVVVFPTRSLKGLVLDPKRVRDDLTRELEQYE